ncbi:hypothetical protein [Sphingobacterium lumbrici]|uniref:hypothetical protein n=1 Tax=Sphingobacterium lumbrici TaxID=2559600 RepID=UPI00112EA42B|nr:hypothetical protein [Sphingobacterium lumbrici]
MIYISAQPDTTYFIWQLEIQLRNLRDLGISRDNIQVLAAYSKVLGLNPNFEQFMKDNAHLATFFVYEDQRDKPEYTSSVRPNILRQHFTAYPELKDRTLMYHDSDILFSRIPHIDNVEENDTCYVSDTRNYLDINYIRSTSDENMLDRMLSIVGMEKDRLIRENKQTGGAQYILKGITADFWAKIERDAEELFIAMRDYNRQLWEKEYPDKKEFRSKKRGIQAWCADMWAVLWNLWLENKQVEIHPEMAFSWPYNPIEDWERLAIQHYSGNIKEKDKFFKKTEYLNYTPWYDDTLLEIPDTNCSYKIVELIRDRKKELDASRKSYSESCIVVHTDILNPERLESWRLFEKYIVKNLDIDVYLYAQEITCEITPDNTIQNKEKLQHVIAQGYRQLLWLPLEYMPDISAVANMLGDATTKNMEWLSFKVQNIYKVDSLFVETFSKILDMELLELNKGKFNILESKEDKFIFLINFSEILTERNTQIDTLFEGDLTPQEGIVLQIPAVFNIL